MILRSDLDPVCPVCDADVGIDFWSAPPYVSGFCAALKQHVRIVGDTRIWWTEELSPISPTLTREICPGSGRSPRVERRPPVA